MPKQKLTGWLTVLIIWLGLAGVNGLSALRTVERAWEPHIVAYPSLAGAIMIFQALTGAGTIAWLYAAWVLYQRESDSLKRARMSLVVGAALRLFGGWSIVIFGGLPGDGLREHIAQLGAITAFVLIFTGAWYLYLLNSKRVREIYAG